MRVVLAAALAIIAFTAPAAADKDSADAELKAERVIKDMKWMGPAEVLNLYVDDLGSNRTGYAEYVCLLLKEHGVDKIDGRPVIVRVLDIDRHTALNIDLVMGGAACFFK